MINESYFCVLHKNRRKHNQHFRTAVFHKKFTLCQIKPNIYIQKTKFASHKEYLFCVLTCRNAKKTQTDQSIPLVFLFVWKQTTDKPLKVTAVKNPFLQCVRYWQNLLWWIFFTLCDDWIITFRESLSYSVTFEAPCSCFPWSKCFERSPYFMCNLHNNNMMLIPKFQSKAD